MRPRGAVDGAADGAVDGAGPSWRLLRSRFSWPLMEAVVEAMVDPKNMLAVGEAKTPWFFSLKLVKSLRMWHHGKPSWLLYVG